MPSVFLSLALFGNIWIWKIFLFNYLIGLLTVSTALLLYLNRRLFIPLFVLLLVVQFQTTQPGSLTLLSNDEKRLQHQRLESYPPISLSFANTKIWIPAGWWFEGRKESIALSRVLKNLSEAIDPNLYFFGNHPRERVGVNEFEKLPYAFLPFFVIGILSLDWRKRKYLLMSLFLPLMLISVIGHNNRLGLFSLFPFFSLIIFYGLSKLKNKKLQILFLTLFIPVLVQIVSYGKL